MEELGVNNPLVGVAAIGLGDAARVYYNFRERDLYATRPC